MRKTIARAAAAVALVLGTLVSTALPSQAATGQWSDSQNTNRPVLYQTNLWYDGAAFKTPSTVPSTGKVTTVSASWRLLDQPPANTTLRVWYCRGASGQASCLPVYTGTPTISGSGTFDLTSANIPANEVWHPAVSLAASTTYVFKPYPVNSSYFQYNVNYSY